MKSGLSRLKRERAAITPAPPLEKKDSSLKPPEPKKLKVSQDDIPKPSISSLEKKLFIPKETGPRKLKKSSQDLDLISQMLDGHFRGTLPAPPKPPPIRIPRLAKEDLEESILQWIRIVTWDKDDTTVSGIGVFSFPGLTWLEVSSKRGVVWRGHSFLEDKYLEPGVDTHSEEIQRAYVRALVDSIIYTSFNTVHNSVMSLKDSGTLSDCSCGFFFIESTKYVLDLKLPLILQPKIKPFWLPCINTTSENCLYVSMFDVRDALEDELYKSLSTSLDPSPGAN